MKMTKYSLLTKSDLHYVLLVSVFLVSPFLTQTQARISEDTLTFQCYDNITAEKVSISHPRQTKHLAEYSELYKEINATLILQATNFTSEFPDSIAWQSAGFVDTVFYSYQKHHNLIIRPDDVWTAIIVQFSLYINANAEALRHSFVKFKGKKQLEVTFDAPVDQVPFDIFIQKIVKLINDNIDPAISDWIKPNFTTTTENDKLTAGVALMATVQKYFEYSLFSVECGIPEITILGNLDDWMVIRKRVEKLNEFELDGKDVMGKWSSMLIRILDQFISMKKGNARDKEFWEQAIRVDYKVIDLICAEVTEVYLNGWITTFTAFDKSGHWQDTPTDDNALWLRIRTDEITSGIVHVPIKIFDQYAKPEESKYTGAIFTGHMGYAVNKDETTLQPMSGWAMTITNNPPEYLRHKL